MILEPKEEYLYIWRDSDKTTGIRVKSKGPKSLKDKIGDNEKYYPLIKKLEASKREIEHFDKGKWLPGLHGYVGKGNFVPEFLNYKPSSEGSHREKKEKPEWMDLIDEKTKEAKRKEDQLIKLASQSDDDHIAFEPYSDIVYDGYAKAFIRYDKEHPNYFKNEPGEASAYYSCLVKGAVWGWKKKLDAKIARGEDIGRGYGAWQGRMKTFEEKAVSALRRNNSPLNLISMHKDANFDSYKDPYITTQSTESDNNRLFDKLDPKTQKAIMAATGLSQKDIDKRMSAIAISDSLRDDAGSTEKPNFEKSDKYLPFAEILKRGK